MGMAIRDKLATTTSVSQVETEGQKWFDEVQLYLQANFDSKIVSKTIAGKLQCTARLAGRKR